MLGYFPLLTSFQDELVSYHPLMVSNLYICVYIYIYYYYYKPMDLNIFDGFQSIAFIVLSQWKLLQVHS